MVEVGVWWLGLVAVWLLTLSSVTWQELAVAIPAGLVCALAARAARVAYQRSWRPRAMWLRWLLVLPLSIVTDSVRVLVRPGAPTKRRVAVSDRAAATVAVSATPGTVVLTDEPDLEVHALTPGGSRLERLVRK